MGEFDDIIGKARENKTELDKTLERFAESQRRALEARTEQRQRTLRLAHHASRLLVAHNIPMDATRHRQATERYGLLGLRSRNHYWEEPFAWTVLTYIAEDTDNVYVNRRVVLEPDGVLLGQDLRGGEKEKRLTAEVSAESTSALWYYTDEQIQLALGGLLVSHGLE